MKNIILRISIFLFLIGTIQVTNAQCNSDDANPQLTGMSFATACVPETQTTTMEVNWSMISADGVATVPAGSWQILISFDALERYTYNDLSVVGPEFTWDWDAANQSLRGTNNTSMTYDISDITDLMIPQGTVEVTVTGVENTSCVAVLSNANVVIVPSFLGGCPEAFQNQISDDAVQSSLGIDVDPLPVELISFSARPNESVNDLKWSTASEDNTESFIIERSNDGFRTQEVVIGKESAVGFSTVFQEYHFTDETPEPTSYYRLKIIDFDGYFEYSEVRVVERKEKSLNIVSIAPNPTQNTIDMIFEIDVEVKERCILSLVDVLGRRVYEEEFNNLESNNAKKLDLSAYPDGIYFLNIHQGRQRVVKRLVKRS